MQTLSVEKFRIGGGQAQLVSIGDIDAGNQGLDQPLVRLATQPPCGEARHALIVIRLVRLRRYSHERLHREPQLPRETEQGRPQHRLHVLRLHQDKAVGNGDQLPVAHHQRTPMLLARGDQLVGQIEFAAEIEGERRLDQKAVGALFQQRIVVRQRVERSAQTVARLEQLHIDLRDELAQSLRRRETADSAANDGDPRRVRVRRRCRRSRQGQVGGAGGGRRRRSTLQPPAPRLSQLRASLCAWRLTL